MSNFKKAIFVLNQFGLDISEKEYQEIEENQKAKGLKKYGHTLEECPKEKYNWKEMAIEEIVDFIQYVNKMKS